ncbi:hypothetical protein EG327_010656 [Venturia inaequalis]|uniref:Zn(2)-C6 fungal-type domain-containing protein n=1 Tax=Venturia inaequalis TaxID=5025 RepID=A0A8H3UF06_VENIN|nr:hypothetical protein EG327_010656 [Venturia inaequalis]
MKCDEKRDVCGPCERSGRECVYKDENEASTSTTLQAVAVVAQTELSTTKTRAKVESTSPPPHTSTLPVRSDVALEYRKPLNETEDPEWKSPQSFIPAQVHVTSPLSTISSTAGWGGLDTAPLKWLDLLAGDARQNDGQFSMDLLSWRQTVQQPNNITSHGLGHDRQPSFDPSLTPMTPVVAPPIPPMLTQEKEPWQSAIQLRHDQIPIFRRFTDRLALWMDLFDPHKCFSSFVPHLALGNEGLMKAILALASRHMSIQPIDGVELDRNAAVQYYHETLHYLWGAMKYESYNRSLELIATALIVSQYEMIDGAKGNWERHLQGVFWIQRTRNIGAESLGLEGAGWWCWLRQDVWAAFRERRRVYSFHRPLMRYAEMGPYDLASKSVYLLAQCVNYSSEKEAQEGANNLHMRVDRGRHISEMLDEWHQNLTVHFKPLPMAEASDDHIFSPIWINPSPLATSIQLYNFARILLLVNEPASGYNEFLRREKRLNDAVDAICGIATMISDEPSTITSTMCLYAAGFYTNDKDARKRDTIVKLIDSHQMRTGWPVQSLSEELQAEWTASDAT